jgi:hypothetical protein
MLRTEFGHSYTNEAADNRVDLIGTGRAEQDGATVAHCSLNKMHAYMRMVVHWSCTMHDLHWVVGHFVD